MNSNLKLDLDGVLVWAVAISTTVFMNSVQFPSGKDVCIGGVGVAVGSVADASSLGVGAGGVPVSDASSFFWSSVGGGELWARVVDC